MGVEKFEDLRVWQEAKALSDAIGAVIKRPAMDRDRALLYAADGRGYLDSTESAQLIGHTNSIGRMLRRLIDVVERDSRHEAPRTKNQARTKNQPRTKNQEPSPKDDAL